MHEDGDMNLRTIRSNLWAPALASCAALTLAACGGGGGGSGAPAPPSSVTIAGTAAKGAVLPGAAVSIKCAVGTGTATTAADGKYTATLTGASLPCALRVVGTDGSVFHSVVAGTGSSGSFAANITPLTELLVAAATGASPGTFFDGFGSGTVVTTASLTQAIAYLKTAVASVADLTGANPVTDALVAGNALDQKIDAVVASFAAAGVTLAQVTVAVVANPAGPTVVTAALAPVASSCAWLKNGRFRMVSPQDTDPKWRTHVIQVNAAGLSFTDQDGVTETLTADGECQFTVDEADAVHKVLVSSGGVLVVHSQSKTVLTDRAFTIGLPEQTLPVAEFAGTWNVAAWDPNSGIATPGYVPLSQEVTLDATGQITAASECPGLAACVTATGPFPRVAANAAAGGFDLIENGANVARVFLFKALSGKAVVVFLDGEGQFFIASRKASLGAVPAVGTVSSFRQVLWHGNGTIDALNEDTTTVTASDAVAGTTTRLLASTNRVDLLSYDTPRIGLRYRAPNSCTINGVASNCAEVIQLPLQGMGITLTMSVGSNPSTAFYQVTVVKP
jgi:hypothetical protein